MTKRRCPVLLAAALLLCAASPVSAQQHPPCDPVTDEGWRMTATFEVVDVKDGAPYQIGPDWVLDRTRRLLPLCNYFNAIGNYSLRSYSLDPVDETERVTLCRAGAAVAPYAGPCRPK